MSTRLNDSRGTWARQQPPDETHFGRDTYPKSVPLRGDLLAELLDCDRLLPVLHLRRAA